MTTVRVGGAALLALLAGCGGAPAPAGHARAAAPPPPAARARAEARPAPAQDPEAALIAQLEKAPVEIQRESAVGPRRAHVAPSRVRVGDLPFVRLGPMLDPKLAPTSLRSVTDTPKELTIRPSSYGWGPGYRAVTVGVSGTRAAALHIGPWLGSVGTFGEGVEVPCGNQGPWEAVLPARWESLTVSAPAGPRTAEYVVVDGWFDRVACKATSVRRLATPVKEIAPGMLYGLRTCGVSCSEEQALTLLLPTARSVVTSRGEVTPMARGTLGVSMPVRRGSADSMMAYVASTPQKASPRGREAPTAPFVVGVEISQAIADPEPVLVTFVQAAAPGDLPLEELDSVSSFEGGE